MKQIHWQEKTITLNQDESVLEGLLRQGVDLAYSCKNGNCHTCMLQAEKGDVQDAQPDIRESWKALGYFLPCICFPQGELTVSPITQQELFSQVKVAAITPLSKRILSITLDPGTPLEYRAGQFINLRRSDGLTRSYSLASHPAQDKMIEIHVQRTDNGGMSQWIHEELSLGDKLELCGPFGHCYYQKNMQTMPMLLVGTGSGLAPLLGIVKDALHNQHQGPIYLYHGSRTADDLYAQQLLTSLARQHDNLHYLGCVSGAQAEEKERIRADELALKNHSNLSGWRVYLCGHPDMVNKMKKRTYLAGADIKHIFADPFIHKAR
ncbi:FAD-binding oxidoreductase [Shewanella nanhaiensis]|uniref:2Fe-2S iron-sulfur cluster binding domain-containing protein n=1 Tax=Shewanella nanhaiensis TaxID=2864872 RepID=A0ABS7E0V7_9GAMM|nr:FAD-binding oxidoreductase [Shewanella nanhaiensis]MBW8183307.1 2Fe-2S iron-sulfur cluster binding domain-containing protein [Shewanella nanhaiensis]